jgi:hypothetical protein
MAALEMLKLAIDQCPAELWNNPADKTKVWHIAYHTLFYTHLYLQDTEESFSPWPKHRPEYESIGQLPYPPHTPPKIGEPYDKESVLDYLAFCRQAVKERIPQLKLDAPSGFAWLPFNKLELQFYTIRHIQQHTGELMERLGVRAGLEFPWVGIGPLEP